MALSVSRVESDADKEALYAFRYRLYVEELRMTSEGDHERRLLVDDHDAYAESYAVWDDGELMGSLRVLYMDDVSDRAPFVEKFRMAPALEHFGAADICTTSRFVLDRRLRHGKIIFRLMREAFRGARARGVRLNYGDCSPHLLPFYEHLGYRRYSRGYNDTEYGFKIPILMLLADKAFLARVRSPIARLVANDADDEDARAWFAGEYPAYVALESAAFLPEEQFFELLTERVASDPLHELALLEGLDREDAQKFLSRATILETRAGDRIIRRGEVDDTLYVLLSGIAEVTVGNPDEPPVAVFGAGDTFGEIGFLTAVPRTASVTACEDSQVLVISGEFMQQFIKVEPAVGARLLLNLSRELAGRLAVSTRRA